MSKVRMTLGMALFSVFALAASAAAAGVPDELSGEPDGAIHERGIQEDVGESEQALKIACTASGDTATGRAWAFLIQDPNTGKCFRGRDPNRIGEPAPSSVAHCKSLGTTLGCVGAVEDL